jgi:iturin family lipopeptide synthetase A
MILHNILEQNIHDTSKGISFFSDKDDVTLSYADLYKNAKFILHELQENYQIKPGDKVLFQTEDNYEFVNIFWACILGGIIPIPLTYANNNEVLLKLFNVWNIVDKPFIILPEKLKEKIEGDKIADTFKELTQKVILSEKLIETSSLTKTDGILHESNEDDIAFIQFSSGSTGNPKGVQLTHKNIITNLGDIQKATGCTPEDSTLSWMPLTHDMGIIGFHLEPMFCKSHQYQMATFLFAFYPMSWLQRVSEHKITITACPNFGYEHFMNCFIAEDFQGIDLSHLRLILNAAEPISVSICHSFLDCLKPFGLAESSIRPVYGLAEASLVVTYTPNNEKVFGYQLNRNKLGMNSQVEEITDANSTKATLLADCGIKLENIDVRINDEQGQEVADNVVGTLCIKGNSVTSGYYNNPEKNKETISEEGWLNTGDLAFKRNDRFVIIGRQKEVIFVNGQNYYASDLERIVHQLPSIDSGKAGVCGVSNIETNSDEIVVFILSKKKVERFVEEEQEIKTHLEKTAGITVKHIIPVKKLPRTTSGKIQRFVLKENFENGEYTQIINDLSEAKRNSDLSASKTEKVLKSTSSMEDQLLLIWQELTKNNVPISVNDNFFEAGGDSLLVAKLANRIEKKYPGIVNVSDIFGYPSIASLAAFINNRLNASKERIVLPSIHLGSKLVTTDSGANKITRARIDLPENYDDHMLSLQLMSAFTYSMYKLTGNSNIEFLSLNSAGNAYKHAVHCESISKFESLIQHLLKEYSNNATDLKLCTASNNRNNAACIIFNRKYIKRIQEIKQSFGILLSVSFFKTHAELYCETKASIRKELISALTQNLILILKSSVQEVKM